MENDEKEFIISEELNNYLLKNVKENEKYKNIIKYLSLSNIKTFIEYENLNEKEKKYIFPEKIKTILNQISSILK